MTQFVVESLGKNGRGRLGQLTWGIGEVETHKTPAFLIHTLGGSVPHLTSDVMGYIFPPLQLRPPLQISIESTTTFADGVCKFGEGIAKFVGLPAFPVFLTVHNPLQPLRGGYNHMKSVALWGRNGKKSLGIEEYLRLVEGYKPTAYQGLSDYDVPSKKRMKKSTAKTLEWLDSASTNQGTPGLFVTIEASWFLIDEEEATRTVKLMLEKLDRILGFVISGFGIPIQTKDPREVKTAKCESVDYSLVDKIISLLPENKPRYIPGPFSPSQIFELVNRGVDLFDSSFVTSMADDGEVFLLDSFAKMTKSILINEELPTTSDSSGDRDCDPPPILLTIKDQTFFSDFSPISKYCSCYTCRKHTKSYINHLFATDELLGPVLLMIHNLTSFTRLFDIFRDALKSRNNIERKLRDT